MIRTSAYSAYGKQNRRHPWIDRQDGFPLPPDNPLLRRRKRILFVGEDVSLAHVARPLKLARSLDPDRYEVHFACGPKYAEFIDGNGFTRHTLPTMPSDRFLKRLAAGAPLYDRTTLSEYVDAEKKLFRNYRPDLVVSDFRVSLGISTCLEGIPHVNLCNAYWSPHSSLSFPTPELPFARWLGTRFAGLALRSTIGLAAQYHARAYNQLRRHHGLPQVSDMFEMYTRGTWTLYLDTPCLAPTRDLPANHRYIGPVIWSPPVELPDELNGTHSERPLIYVTLGSSGDARLLPRVLRALGALPVSAWVATAGRIDLTDVPMNVRVADYLPGDEMLEKATICISNGGSTTGYQALRAGVPVLGFPSNADQFYHMGCVEEARAGTLMRPSLANEERIGAAIRTLIRNVEAHRSAAQLAEEIRANPAEEHFRRFIEEILPEEVTGQPRTAMPAHRYRETMPVEG